MSLSTILDILFEDDVAVILLLGISFITLLKALSCIFLDSLNLLALAMLFMIRIGLDPASGGGGEGGSVGSNPGPGRPTL